MRGGKKLSSSDKQEQKGYYDEAIGQSHMLELTGVRLGVNRFRSALQEFYMGECENWNMRVRFLMACVVAASLALAQVNWSVKRVQDFVRSSAEQKQPDKDVAAQLHRIKMSEKLEDADIEALLSVAGPKTVDALKSLRDSSANLAAPTVATGPKPAYKQPPPPPDSKQREIIEAAREYALNYTKSLPDFVCAQITDRYYDPTGKEAWRKGDDIRAKLSYNGQQEKYDVVMVNGQSVMGKTMESLGGTTSTGEFATMLRYIFEPVSQASFQWDRLARWNGHVTYVFDYAVERERSSWGITDKDTKRTVTPAYRGLVYIDQSTGQILRFTAEAVDIPADFPIQVAKETLTYDWADLSGNKFLLPAESEVRLDRGRQMSKNVATFTSYRKFSSDAVITFDK